MLCPCLFFLLLSRIFTSNALLPSKLPSHASEATDRRPCSTPDATTGDLFHSIIQTDNKRLRTRQIPRKVPLALPVILFSSIVILSGALPASAAVNAVQAVEDVVDPRFFVAGFLCAAFSHGITTPIDVVKTRMQAEPIKYKGRGFADAAIQIVEEGKVGALLAGLGPTVAGYGVEGAAKFGLYETLKPEMAHLLQTENPAIPYLIASLVAGAVASIVLCPMEQARIRLVTSPDFASNFLEAIPRLTKETGVQGLFYGFPAMLSKQVPYTAGKQISFDVIASFLYGVAIIGGFAEDDVKYEVSVAAAAMASVVACVMSHPGDVILTASYKSSANKSFGDAIRGIIDEQGADGFLSGISARFLHVGIIITTQLVVYDTIKQLLGLPATGS